MLDYLDALTADDWMLRVLRCPNCGSEVRFKGEGLECIVCESFAHIARGIPLFKTPPSDKREYLFEMNRYKGIALKPPDTYHGFDASYPSQRVELIKKLLEDKPLFLNVGQGFGQLEQSMPHKAKICLDQCLEFLRYCQEQAEIPNTRYVMGFGERMPFQDNYFPAVVSDSVFQTLVDQREFLIENARVLKGGGTFILGITYKWNYPRKPQDFPADDPELLCLFLEELGIKAEATYHHLRDGVGSNLYLEDGDFLLITGIKTPKQFLLDDQDLSARASR